MRYSNSIHSQQHEPKAPNVPDLAQTVKPWSDLFKIHERFRRCLNPEINIDLRQKLF